MAYVSEYGNYGVEEVFVFDGDKLTPRQWDILGELIDEDKLPYVAEIIAGNDVSEFEEGFDE